VWYGYVSVGGQSSLGYEFQGYATKGYLFGITILYLT
jgi:hypothetical protein